MRENQQFLSRTIKFAGNFWAEKVNRQLIF